MSHNYLNKNRTQELINTIRGHLSDIATVLSNLASGDARDNTKAPINHTQPSSTITAMTGYSKPQSTSAIAATDTLNEAIGKLEKGLEDAGGGDLEAHIATNVEDDGGVHGIRCYNGKLEVYNDYSQEWCDPSEIGVITGNVSGIAVYARYHFLEIKWSDPSSSLWDGTKVVMKEGSYPEDENDGLLIIDNKVKDAYKTTPMFLYDLDPSVTYYFQFFPYTNRGAVNRNTANRASGTPLASKSATYTVTGLVGSTSGGGVASPSYSGTNSTFTPAKFNDDGSWNWGSWKDAWFIPRPCMLKYDGTVDYYLDPNDYTKKEDGTASDVANLNYEGNAMMEWPEMYYTLGGNSYDGTSTISISDQSGTYHRSKFYTSIYNCTGSNKLRSISGIKTNSTNYCTFSKEDAIASARANNIGNNAKWHIELISDKMIIAALITLITQSVNTQATCGYGMVSVSSSTATNYITGTLNDKGLFYGSKTDKSKPVKVFGMENYWGHYSRWIDGYRRSSGTIYHNFNEPNVDGTLPTTSNLYYVETILSSYSSSNVGVTSSDYMLHVAASQKGVFSPTINYISASRTATTGLCDRFYLPKAGGNGTTGGSYSDDTYCGAYYLFATNSDSHASLTCR